MEKGKGRIKWTSGKYAVRDLIIHKLEKGVDTLEEICKTTKLNHRYIQMFELRRQAEVLVKRGYVEKITKKEQRDFGTKEVIHYIRTDKPYEFHNV